MKVYLLYYDTDNGCREDWNTFYTPCEAFDSEAKRDARKAVLEKDPEGYEFHEIELDVA